MAETYGDKNGYNARKRRKSDAGYIHGGGSVAWRARRRGRGAVQRKATPVTYTAAAGAWRGGTGVARRHGCGAVQRKATPVTYSKTDATVEAGSRRAPSAVRVVAASRGTKRLAP